MKTLFGLMIIVAVFLVGGTAFQAQQQPPESVETLREQIRKLERIENDPNTSAEVKALNQTFLEARRRQLGVASRKRIDSLRAYLTSVKGTLSVEELRKVELTISELENGSPDPSKNTDGAAATAERVSVRGAESATTNGSSSTPPGTSAALAENPARTPAPVLFAPETDCTSDNSYKNAPPLLTDITERVAEDIVAGKSVNQMVNGNINKMVFYAIADALTVNTPTQVRSIKNLKAYQYLGETARTDKQIGAGSSSAGTTSAIEKPGFARLLGFAVEKGAILKDVNGSSLTLSTSPYVLYTFNGGGDTAANYARAGFLNRVGLSASFNIEDQNIVLASARRNQLTDWSVRARLYGDRSTRTAAFQKFWRDEVQEAIEGRLNALGDSFRFMNDHADEFDVFEPAEAETKAALNALIASPTYTSASAEDKKKMLSNAILCNIRSGVFDKITSGRASISSTSRDQIVNRHVPALAAALNNLEVVRGVLKEKLDEISKGPLATFAYINHRDPSASDYSEFKFLFEQDKTVFGLMKIVGNAGLSMYNKPNGLLNQARIRDFSAALSFEGSIDSPFLTNQPDLSKITYAFTGNYQRMKENTGMAGRKADLAAFQFKLDFPIYAGLAIPIALTYSNGTEHSNKQDTRLNFGFKFDMDKLFALTQLLSQP